MAGSKTLRSSSGLLFYFQYLAIPLKIIFLDCWRSHNFFGNWSRRNLRLVSAYPSSALIQIKFNLKVGMSSIESIFCCCRRMRTALYSPAMLIEWPCLISPVSQYTAMDPHLFVIDVPTAVQRIIFGLHLVLIIFRYPFQALGIGNFENIFGNIVLVHDLNAEHLCADLRNSIPIFGLRKEFQACQVRTSFLRHKIVVVLLGFF